jgi:hypothetical protein
MRIKIQAISVPAHAWRKSCEQLRIHQADTPAALRITRRQEAAAARGVDGHNWAAAGSEPTRTVHPAAAQLLKIKNQQQPKTRGRSQISLTSTFWPI